MDPGLYEIQGWTVGFTNHNRGCCTLLQNHRKWLEHWILAGTN